jgi:hypothetical protein
VEHHAWVRSTEMWAMESDMEKEIGWSFLCSRLVVAFSHSDDAFLANPFFSPPLIMMLR